MHTDQNADSDWQTDYTGTRPKHYVRKVTAVTRVVINASCTYELQLMYEYKFMERFKVVFDAH